MQTHMIPVFDIPDDLDDLYNHTQDSYGSSGTHDSAFQFTPPQMAMDVYDDDEPNYSMSASSSDTKMLDVSFSSSLTLEHSVGERLAVLPVLRAVRFIPIGTIL